MLKLTTPCFVEGGWIPDYNAGFGEDQSPEFHIEEIDAKAETMVITLVVSRVMRKIESGIWQK